MMVFSSAENKIKSILQNLRDVSIGARKKKMKSAPFPQLQIPNSVWAPHVMPCASHAPHSGRAKPLDALLIGQEHGLKTRTTGDLFFRHMRPQELRVFGVIDKVTEPIANDGVARHGRHIMIDESKVAILREKKEVLVPMDSSV
jgi:hypothetical protein